MTDSTGDLIKQAKRVVRNSRELLHTSDVAVDDSNKLMKEQQRIIRDAEDARVDADGQPPDP